LPSYLLNLFFNIKKRTFQFLAPNIKLRAWLPDELYEILQQYPTRIPSSIPGIGAEHRTQRWMQLPLLPELEEERETYLEDERNSRPRDLLYRFYACGGFWLSDDAHITHFLKSFRSRALGDMVPFLRVVLKVLNALLIF
jgi:hypothetical protein